MQLYVVTIWSKCWSESEVYENLSYLFISANCKECHIKKKKNTVCHSLALQVFLTAHFS